MMKYLLHWSHGNVQMALAAYNAGQRNWRAGLGYADEILSIAG
jgi:soluble lytic murein transglycosylase-like protein